MKNYDKKIDSSCSSFYCSHKSFKQALNHGLIFKKVHKVIQPGCGMSQKLPVNSFKWIKKLSKSDERFIKDHDENSSKEYFLEVDVEYPKNVFNLHSNLSSLPEINKIKKCNKPVYSIRDKENVIVHIRALKQALNHGLIF